MAFPSHNDVIMELVGHDGEVTAEEIAGALLDPNDPSYVSAQARETLFRAHRWKGKQLGSRYQESWLNVVTRPGNENVSIGKAERRYVGGLMNHSPRTGRYWAQKTRQFGMLPHVPDPYEQTEADGCLCATTRTKYWSECI